MDLHDYHVPEGFRFSFFELRMFFSENDLTAAQKAKYVHRSKLLDLITFITFVALIGLLLLRAPRFGLSSRENQ